MLNSKPFGMLIFIFYPAAVNKFVIPQGFCFLFFFWSAKFPHVRRLTPLKREATINHPLFVVVCLRLPQNKSHDL